MEVYSPGGRGFTVVHTVIDRAALKRYNLRVIAKVRTAEASFTQSRLSGCWNILQQSRLPNTPTSIYSAQV